MEYDQQYSEKLVPLFTGYRLISDTLVYLHDPMHYPDQTWDMKMSDHEDHFVQQV